MGKSWPFVGLVFVASLLLAGCGLLLKDYDGGLSEGAAGEAEAASQQDGPAGLQEEQAAAESELSETERDPSGVPSALSSPQSPSGGEQTVSARPERPTTAPEGSQVGYLAPGFQLKDLDGKTVSLRELSGRPVMLNFWASWCGPCRVEMPYLQQTYDRWRDKGLVLMTINLREPASTARQFMQEGKYSLPVLLDANGDVANRYNVTAIPTTFFVSGDGVIQERKIGSFPSVEAIEDSLGKIMGTAEPPPSPPGPGVPELTLSAPETAGLSVTFIAATMLGTPGATIVRIYWDWGDGTSEDHWFPASHSYNVGGTYTVKVTFYQSNGLSATESVNVHVSPVSSVASPILLISPAEGAFVDNGRFDRSDDIIWDFDWSDVPGASQYQLFVKGKLATITLIDTMTTSSSFHYVSPASYIADHNRFGWTWKVRALVDAQWGDWATVTFNVEPLNSD
ncbi:MAG: hypothetical protein A2147_09870 [Chloroflexi bacterium RBG_16_57_8]|nr:MAG: hypothetical protein A2147_09870 [Chloroflexi bacterium RBG_16_57_8]